MPPDRERSLFIIGLMVAFYLVLCFRAAWLMKRSGRSFWLWLVVSLLLTNIPAMTLLMRDRQRGYCPADLAEEDEQDETDEGDHHLHRRRAHKRPNR